MITLKRVKGSPLTHDELDDNFAGSANLFDDQTIDGVKTFLDSPIVPTPLPGDNSTKVATTEFVRNAINLIGLNPLKFSFLNTLCNLANNWSPVICTIPESVLGTSFMFTFEYITEDGSFGKGFYIFSHDLNLHTFTRTDLNPYALDFQLTVIDTNVEVRFLSPYYAFEKKSSGNIEIITTN